jgi:DNA-binding transcriptional MocR family regulator
VCSLPPALPAQIITATDTSKVSLTGIQRLLSTLLEYQQQGDCVDLALACPTGSTVFPVTTLHRLTAQVLRTQPQLLSTYVLPPGSKQLRDQIARRGLRLGMMLHAEDILLTHGTMEALHIAIRAATKPGDKIAVETPTFYNLYPAIRDLGRDIIEIPTSPQTGMSLDALEIHLQQQSIQAVLTIPTGHNPLGFTMPVSNRKRLAALAGQYSIPVIEDAMYAELQYGLETIPNIKAFDTEGWILTCASYTKTVAPDFRIGWLEAGRYRDIAMQLKFTSSVAESALLTETLGLFFANGGYDVHLRKIRKYYANQIDKFRTLIVQYFPLGTSVSRPQSGFILWLELPKTINTLELFHRALDEQILCMPGVLCSGDKQHQHCLRMAVCTELTPHVISGVIRLGELAQTLLHES